MVICPKSKALRQTNSMALLPGGQGIHVWLVGAMLRAQRHREKQFWKVCLISPVGPTLLVLIFTTYSWFPLCSAPFSKNFFFSFFHQDFARLVGNQTNACLFVYTKKKSGRKETSIKTPCLRLNKTRQEAEQKYLRTCRGSPCMNISTVTAHLHLCFTSKPLGNSCPSQFSRYSIPGGSWQGWGERLLSLCCGVTSKQVRKLLFSWILLSFSL